MRKPAPKVMSESMSEPNALLLGKKAFPMVAA